MATLLKWSTIVNVVYWQSPLSLLCMVVFKFLMTLYMFQNMETALVGGIGTDVTCQWLLDIRHNLYAGSSSMVVKYRTWWLIPYGAKFLRSIILHFSRMSFKPQELHSAKFRRYSQLNMICGIPRHHTAGSTALLDYFSKASEVEKLPDPQGALAKDNIVHDLFH